MRALMVLRLGIRQGLVILNDPLNEQLQQLAAQYNRLTLGMKARQNSGLLACLDRSRVLLHTTRT
ncbi:uncharacterized protein PHALS_06575 [Plasmopara halstedii]|uniref:Uncharacterized protein n=1 Tax=Plasmopara halstedii TaxID=4781 RepID=A0A0P1B3S8_PLAHL|nr:uncharacterized protein PHALS_06575 [Plasmopara halstedii]CEG48770.1 hypothetical protein PHALS_06575 [Plasmopara halstedii]|eukprot:XP_024585139.1 hypothetical protein PHALS_06575 [Plasmopara halstedii]